MPRLSTRSGTIAVDCLNCASCDPALSECAAAMRAVPAPSPREGGKNKLTLILAIAVPVAVVVLVVLAFMIYRVRVRQKRAPPSPAAPSPLIHEVKGKGSLKSVTSSATDGQSSGTHISTLPPYSPSAVRGSPGTPRCPPPLPPRHEVDEGVCVGPPDDEEYEDDASSTSSFGAIAPQYEFDNAFILTHRSLSPVPEERESMMTRNSAYSSRSLRTFASEQEMCPSAAQQFRDMTLAQWPATPPPPPPCHPMRARAYSGTYAGSPVVL